jgi:hypothetical protein
MDQDGQQNSWTKGILMKRIFIRKIKHYSGEVTIASQDLRDITRALTWARFDECMSIMQLRFYRYASGGANLTTIERVDELCGVTHSGVKDFSKVCLTPGLRCQYAIETTNDELLSLFSRINKLKAFL